MMMMMADVFISTMIFAAERWCSCAVDVSRLLVDSCYPRMPIGRVWIYRLLFVCFYGFLRRG